MAWETALLRCRNHLSPIWIWCIGMSTWSKWPKVGSNSAQLKLILVNLFVSYLNFINLLCTRRNLLERIAGEPSITVGQNIRFESAEKMPKRWIVQIIKHWFLDGLIRTRAILEKYLTACIANHPQLLKIFWSTFRRPNYTQLVWPEVEFIGCAAAQFSINGKCQRWASEIKYFSIDRYVNGYMLACNYHPKANDSLELAFKRGEPCTDCPNNQRGCSRIFPGLCGIGSTVLYRCMGCKRQTLNL